MTPPRTVDLSLSDEDAAAIESALVCAAGEYGGDKELALAYIVRLARDEARQG